MVAVSAENEFQDLIGLGKRVNLESNSKCRLKMHHLKEYVSSKIRQGPATFTF